jgi:serine/threonine protein kinase
MARRDSIEETRARLRQRAILAGRYELQRELGIGFHGIVFQALDRRRADLGHPDPYVAVKVFEPEAARRGDDVRDACLRIGQWHPNVVAVYDVDREGDLHFATMEFLRGSRLTHRYYHRAATWSDVEPIVRGICAGLRFANENGWTRGDVTPRDVFLTTSGQVKLLYPGTRRLPNPNVLDWRVGATTTHYAAPEALDNLPHDVRDDVFSLGVLVYELLAGRRPFQRPLVLDAAHEAGDVERILGLSQRQWDTLAAALAPTRGDRPRDLTKFENGLFGGPRLRTIDHRVNGE